MYIHNLQQDVQFYKKTAQEQQIRLIEQNKDIKDLQQLTDVMFKYITDTGGSIYTIPREDSPIHRGPL